MSPERDRPLNVLLITSDQQRWDTLGRLNPAIRTPNLDRLAERGILFERGYTVNPVCTPSRCSLLTGQYPSRHGCFHVGTSLPADYGPTVAEAFADAGYATSLIGKAHFQACKDPVSPESAPHVHDLDHFDGWHGPYFGFEHAELVIGHTSEPHAGGMHYGAWLRQQGVERSEFFDIHDYDHYGAWSLPEALHGSTWVADRSIAAVDRARDEDRPFFLWASFQDPHNPYVTPEPWASMYDAQNMPAAVPMPDVDDRPAFYRSLAAGEFYGDDPDLQERAWGDVKIRPELSAAEVGAVRAVYYGMVSLMDRHIGRLLDHLEADGRLDNTLVVFTSDHGDYLGDHGLFGKGLPAYEAMQRVPFVVAHPDCRRRGARSGALQSLVDIERSCLEAAGLAATPQSQGVSQVGSWIDPGHAARDHALFEFRPAQGPFVQRTCITETHKLVTYDRRDEGELYDLQADPQQTHNLFGAPGQSEEQACLQEFVEAARPAEDVVRERRAVA